MSILKDHLNEMLGQLNGLEQLNTDKPSDLLEQAIKGQRLEIRNMISGEFPTVSSHSLVRNVTDEEYREITVWVLYYDAEEQEVLGLRREVSRMKYEDEWDLIGIREAFVCDTNDFESLTKALEYDLDHLITPADIVNKNGVDIATVKSYLTN